MQALQAFRAEGMTRRSIALLRVGVADNRGFGWCTLQRIAEI
jgi:hypothetical protein